MQQADVRRRSRRTARRLVRGESYNPGLFRRHFTAPVAGLLVLAMAGFALLFFWSVRAQNEQARRTSIIMVQTGINLKRNTLMEGVRLQTYWTEAYDNVSARYNQSWVERNWGPWMHEAGVPLVFLIGPDNAPLYSNMSGKAGQEDPFARFSPDLTHLVEAVRRAPNGVAKTDLLRFDGQPAVVAAARISREAAGEARPDAQHVLIIGVPFDGAMLENLAATYHLGPLSVRQPDGGGSYNSLDLVSNGGEVLGQIFWPNESTGPDLPTLFWILALALLVGLVVLTWFILRNSRHIVLLVAASEVRALKMAQRDALTGLVNRSRFRAMLMEAHARLCPSDPPIGVLFIDLDGFKPVNDKLGHTAGDELLRQVAGVLKRETKGIAVPARLGGDEFAILIHGKPQPETAEDVSERIRAALCEPLSAAGSEVTVGASIGIAFLGPEDGDAADVLRRADIAMYEAKKLRGGACFYSAELEELSRRRRDQMAAFRAALEGNSLSLVYQPQVSLRDGRVMAVEAQLQWDQPGRYRLSAEELMALAEESGCLSQLTQWMLEEACRQAQGWADLPVGINVAISEIRKPGFVAQVESVLDRTGLPAARLELELPETVFNTQCSQTRRALTVLSGLGVRMVLDRFGGERASLAALRSSQFVKIKLDRDLLPHASWSDNARAVLSALGTLGRSLGVPVVAEGVETESNASMVMACGCALGQGYFFSPPLTAAQVSRLAEEGERLALPSTRWVFA
ncbi:putative bifunctional diguanylate cyclase/phosphodiesterase [Pedomonas mirosovicensis]|uniref:putative bifunctional diguanylate cyclase/phosphodiesterase n=1 Tax=Pedomonas mirosovicensis TaxID=2908641 RepID=UPI002168321E|nr:EAL domain-containing protein [Pedomonas mirosovicensis]MCH8684219.1 EAL domain-containing protein [Pedomonas mirosovicensis]